MFICSVRAGTIKFFGAVLLALALFLTILVLAEPGVGNAVGTDAEAVEVVNYSGIKTDEDRVEFLSTFGWQVAANTPSDEVSFLL